MVLIFPPDSRDDLGLSEQESASALDPAVLDNPNQTIASVKRELLRMIDLVDRMFRPVPALYETESPARLEAVRRQDEFVNAALSDIRSYVAHIPAGNYSKHELKMVRGLMDYAIRLETAGDVIAKTLSDIIEEKHSLHAEFSDEGWMELVHMHEAVLANFKLASNVLISDDLESARLLVMEKSEIKRFERKSRKRHLARLHEGRSESFESSDVHLETLRALRDINSHVAAIAYPILYRNGQLLETRLIEDMTPSSQSG